MKRLLLLVLALSFGLILPGAVKATIVPPYTSGSSQSEQYYSVIFDKEQEAAVLAKLTFANVSKEAISSINLDIPGKSTRIISTIQENIEPTRYCIRYDYSKPNPQNQNCLEWGENYYGPKTYALIERDQTKDQKSENSLKLELPLTKAIESGRSGTIFIYYKSKGFTNKTWNGYNFAFETIKSNYDIDRVRVAVDVSDDLAIKETAQGETNYQDNAPVLPALTAKSFASMPAMESLSSSVSNYGGVVKETSALDPGENFKVEGRYYNNQFLRDFPTIIGVGVTFLLIMGVLVYVIRKEKRS